MERWREGDGRGIEMVTKTDGGEGGNLRGAAQGRQGGSGMVGEDEGSGVVRGGSREWMEGRRSLRVDGFMLTRSLWESLVEAGINVRGAR